MVSSTNRDGRPSVPRESRKRLGARFRVSVLVVQIFKSSLVFRTETLDTREVSTRDTSLLSKQTFGRQASSTFA